jgi:pyridoxine kinase
MRSILSIQSHVAYGYVGNRAAVFPLQRLGFDVTALNTVQFSNHTAYPQWRGDVFSAAQVRQLIDGLRLLGVFPQYKALLTGYLGNPEISQVIIDLVHELKEINPQFIYCCDPVMGDSEGGCYVHPDVRANFKNHLAKIADILTPNQFELNYLSQMPVNTLADAQAACDSLIQQGPKTILVTSLVTQDTPQDTMQMLLHQADGSWLIETPRLYPQSPPNGAGDLTAALLLANTLENLSPDKILAQVAASVYGIYKATADSGKRELQVIAAQNELVSPTHHFKVKKL